MSNKHKRTSIKNGTSTRRLRQKRREMEEAIAKEILGALGVRQSKSRELAIVGVLSPLCSMYVAAEAVMADQRAQIDRLECRIDEMNGVINLADGC